MAFSGLEMVLIPIVTGGVGVAIGKLWGSNGRVTMERCTLIHKSIDKRLESIDRKLDDLTNRKVGE